MKDRTKEEAMIYLEEVLRPRHEGTPSNTPGRFCHVYGLETPAWVKKCRRMRLKKYFADHPDRRLKWTKNIQKCRRANPEKCAEYSKAYYDANTDMCHARTYSYLFLKRNNLLMKGWQIHHLAGEDYKTFIYLPADVHKLLHRVFGHKNEDVGLREVFKSMDMIPQYMLFVDFKLVDMS